MDLHICICNFIILNVLSIMKAEVVMSNLPSIWIFLVVFYCQRTTWSWNLICSVKEQEWLALHMKACVTAHWVRSGDKTEANNYLLLKPSIMNWNSNFKTVERLGSSTGLSKGLRELRCKRTRLKSWRRRKILTLTTNYRLWPKKKTGKWWWPRIIDIRLLCQITAWPEYQGTVIRPYNV
jgi:hypothetical protein